MDGWTGRWPRSCRRWSLWPAARTRRSRPPHPASPDFSTNPTPELGMDDPWGRRHPGSNGPEELGGSGFASGGPNSGIRASGRFLLRIAFLFRRLQGTGDDLFLAADVLVGDEVFSRVLAGRELVHHVQHQALDQLTQGPGAGLLLDGFLRDGPQGIRSEFQLRILHFEKAL